MVWSADAQTTTYGLYSTTGFLASALQSADHLVFSITRNGNSATVFAVPELTESAEYGFRPNLPYAYPPL